jgi:hypothetical protein
MKRKIFFGLAFSTGFSLQVSASSGLANDGLVSMLLLGCSLLLIAGLIEGIGYIGKNRKILVQRFTRFIKREMSRLKNLIQSNTKSIGLEKEPESVFFEF